MSVIYGHPVIAATRALRFADHVTKRNGGSGDENEEHTISLPPLPSGLVSEHEQIGGQIIRMRDRMSVLYGHPVIAATRALRFADHVTKETETLGTRMGNVRSQRVVHAQ